jgi:hypothetical protein
VTELNAAIVLPAGSTAPQTLTLSGGSITTQSTSGPGLPSPQRSDAIYFSAGGAPLCAALDPPVLLGTLTTGAIGGTQLAAAALTVEGSPGNLAEDAAGAIPFSDIRLVNGLPLPVANLELGPAVQTSGGTRWEVCLTGSEEFHRVAFGLIAPTGTTTSDMRWLGCDTTPNGSGERTCDGAAGWSPYTEATTSWTVGPLATPSGTQLPHTMYVVLEGNRWSSGLLGLPRTLNFKDEPVCIGAVELSGSPDLEPALTNDGVNDVDDRFNPGTPVTAYDQVLLGSLDPTQVKLVGAFNPAEDLDGDGIQDLGDNCPFEANPAQSNRGSFLDDTDESDFLGDACQCGEATDDGAVMSPEDFDEIRDYLSGRATVTDPAIIEARCSVVGTVECNIRDLVFLKQAIDAAATNVETRCDAALSPANAP